MASKRTLILKTLHGAILPLLFTASQVLSAVPAGSLVRLDQPVLTSVAVLKAGYQASRATLAGVQQPTSTAVENAFIALMDKLTTKDVPSRGILYASTDAKGEPRTYSGRVFLPSREGKSGVTRVPLVIYMHGTETRRLWAPYESTGDETFFGALGAEICGMAVAMPDGPGMGADPSSLHHPYFHAASLAPGIIDMIRALEQSQGAQGVFDGKDYAWDGTLYIMGYSEGGFEVMAALRALQLDPVYSKLNITVNAAACMAGPYDFLTSAQAILANATTPLDRPYIQADLLVSWAQLFPTEFPLTQTANPVLMGTTPRATVDKGSMPSWLLDKGGVLPGSQITQMLQARLTGNPNTEVLATQIVMPMKTWATPAVMTEITNNGLVGGWAPRYPVLLAQSPDDEVVPFSNTVTIWNSWEKQGAKPLPYRQLAVDGKGPGHLGGALMGIPMAFAFFKLHAELVKLGQDYKDAKEDLNNDIKDTLKQVDDLSTSVTDLVKKPTFHLPDKLKVHLPKL